MFCGRFKTIISLSFSLFLFVRVYSVWYRRRRRRPPARLKLVKQIYSQFKKNDLDNKHL